MKIVLFGRNGQVGEALRAALAPLGEVVAFGRREAPFDTAPAELAALIAHHRPDVVVNAAAYTAVDAAETDAATARRVNRDAVAELAAAAQRIGALLVHYSTDYVYDGAKPSAYLETDPTAPLGVYGRTKLEGDEAVLASGCRHVILRVSWVYAPGHNNFPQAMLALARKKDRLDVVADQIGAPTSARIIAAATAAMIAKIAAAPNPDALDGLYHLATGGWTSRTELARFIVEEASARGEALSLAPEEIHPIATADYPSAAARPLNSRLDTGKLSAAFGIELPAWQADVRRWLDATLAGERA